MSALSGPEFESLQLHLRINWFNE